MNTSDDDVVAGAARNANAVGTRGPESLVTALAGMVLGLSSVHLLVTVCRVRAVPPGLRRAAALGGMFSGFLAGWRRIYDWRTWRGRRAFLADHTWALATTTGGVIVAGANMVQGAAIEDSLSRRQNRLVFARGLVVRRGFAMTMGYVVSGAADRHGVVTPRRRRLVTVHEDAHIWQARRWGPLYPLLYGSWLIGGSIVGVARWAYERIGNRDSERMTRSFAEHVDAASYYSNPFEWRAYSDDRNWPPSGVDPSLVWSQPCGVTPRR